MKYIKEYENYIKVVKGLSEGSIEVYMRDINSLDTFLKHKNEDNITEDDIVSFLAYCKKNGNNAKTQSRKIASLSSFFNYTSRKHNTPNPMVDIKRPKVETRLPKYLTLEESEALLETTKGTANEKRDYCIFTLFLNCGMRLEELSNIKVTDIREDGTMRILGKGNKERTVYLNESCVEAINDYLSVRPSSRSKNLFLLRTGEPFSRRGIQDLTKRRLIAIGRGDCSTHKLRHTAATLMYQYAGADLLAIKEILGHSSLDMTQIYTHINNEQANAAVHNNPLNSRYADIEPEPEPEPPQNDNIIVLKRKYA